jgi:hypothetical protein
MGNQIRLAHDLLREAGEVMRVRELLVRCPDCGDMEVSAGDVFVARSAPDRMSYTFRCPLCLSVTVKDCDPRAGRLLLLAGAEAEPSTVADLAAFGLEHIDKFRRQLAHPNWYDRFREAG